jgi:hypothetical protein
MVEKCKLHGETCDGDCIDPNVDNGMMTKVWGPAGWLFLHCVTFGYPYSINSENPDHQTKKQDYKTFFTSLGKVMPCRYCRDSYEEFIKESPIDNSLNTRKDLVRWLYDIHNKVNQKLGVADCNIIGLKEMITKYEKFRAKCKKTTDEERENNISKGCVTPADGTKKRCILKVVSSNSGDVTRRSNHILNKSDTELNSDDFYIFEKKNVKIIGSTIILLLLILFIVGAIYNYKK